jgi:hypothetical protein
LRYVEVAQLQAEPQRLAAPSNDAPIFHFLQMVFAECGIGAIVLTLNAVLLGGEIVFFQSLCLLGYCLFPMCVSAIICASIANKVGKQSCRLS